MLRDNFYHTITMQQSDCLVTATLELHADHVIFLGHFPGAPVVPGVCILQMVKEVLEKALAKALLLSKADFMKFLAVIDPRINKVITVEIRYKLLETDIIETSASLTSGGSVCFKFQGSFCSGFD